MKKILGGVTAFLITLMMWGLSRTEIYEGVASNGLVIALLLFTFTTIGVLVGLGFEKFEEPKPKSKKKENKEFQPYAKTN